MTSSVHACEATAQNTKTKMLQATSERPGLCRKPSFVENRIQLHLFRVGTARNVSSDHQLTLVFPSRSADASAES